LSLYGYTDGDPVNHSDPFGLCTLGDTFCLFSGVFDRAVNSVIDAVTAIPRAIAERSSVYVRGGAGILTTEVSGGADGLTLKTGPVVGTHAVVAGAGIRERLMRAPKDAVELDVGAEVGKRGVLSISVSATVATNKKGEVALTSISIEGGAGLGRNGKELRYEANVRSSDLTSCFSTGSGCDH
jgi:hypothetical protein